MGDEEHVSVRGKKRIMYWERLDPNPKRYKKTGRTNYQAHHKLPCAAFKESIAEAKKDAPELEKGLKYFTNWNVNDGHNLMPMPTRAAFQAAFGKKGGKKVPGVADNKPCHQPTSWGHIPHYNDAVKKDLKTVWAKVKITVNEKHKAEYNSIAGDLTTLEKKWEGHLTAGRTCTAANWKTMMTDLEDDKAWKTFMMYKLSARPF